MPAVLGGVFIGVLSALPIVQLCNCCCLWIIGGGALAAYLEQQHNQAIPIKVMQGARTGALAGLVGAFVWLVITQLLDVVLAPLQARVVGEILSSARDLPPEVRSWLESIEAGRAGGHVFGFFLFAIFGSAISALGGAISAAYFRNDVPPALGGPIEPPPLP